MVDQEKSKDTMTGDVLDLEEEDDKGDIAEALSELIEELASDENIRMFSDLSQQEIKHIAVLKSMNDSVVDEFLEEFESLQVSYRRKGREELIEIAESVGSLASDEEEKSKLQRLKGVL